MISTNSLPWDDADGSTVVRTDGGDMHARATGLATAAMMAAASQPIVNPADTDYGRAQADYEARLAEMRADNARNHVAANNARAEAARIAKAERQAAHEARNAAAKQAAAERKIAKAA